MKKFLKENWLWLILAIVTIALFVSTFYLPDTETGERIEKMLLFPFCIIGAFTIFIGIGTIIQYCCDKFVKHTWQALLIFLILLLSTIILGLAI
jgi:hypothetical protein